MRCSPYSPFRSKHRNVVSRDEPIVRGGGAYRSRDLAEAETSIFGKAIDNAVNGLLFYGKRTAASEPTVWFVNAYFCKAIGTDASHIVGCRIDAIAAQRGNRAAERKLRMLLAAGTCQNVPLAFRLPGQAKRRFELSITLIDHVNGEEIYLAVLHDTTEHYAAELALREARIIEARNEVLVKSERRMRDLFDGTPAIMYTLDRDLRFLSSLGGGLRTIGMRPDQVVGLLLPDLTEAKDSEATIQSHRRALAGESVTFESEIFGRPFRTYLEPLRDASDAICGLSGISFDLSEVARAERSGKTGSWSHVVDEDEPVFSLEAQRLFGLSGEHGRGAYYDRVVADDRAFVHTEMMLVREEGLTRRFEFRIQVGDAVRYVLAMAEAFRDEAGEIARIGGFYLDVTERRLAQFEAARIAATDAVTGLANRAAFATFVETRERSDVPPHCFLLNLHRFHFINEAFGRAFGDRVLAAVAARLKSLAGSSFVARLESDIFAIVCPGTIDASEYAARIYEAFGDHLEVDDRRVSVSLAIGIASIAPGATVETVVFEAELAVAAARKLGLDRFAFFTSALAEAALRRSLLDRDIQQAIERDELAVHYQPIVDVRGELVKLEALLRWRHPVLGAIGPDEFIPIAEENGAILPIGRWVMETACAQIQIVRRAYALPLRVAVNVSAKQFIDADFSRFIMHTLARCELPPGALEIEITESTLVSNPADATHLLAELRRLGVTVSVDDFGTGYSSLSSLRHLPIDNLKIDRSFVSATPSSAEACAIVETILGLAAKLSLRVIAEGVETDAQAAYLRAQGCDMLQGYRYSRPLPADALLAFVESRFCEIAPT